MENFLDLVTKRRSVRNYQDEDISQNDLNKILESARLAPSSFNRQGFRLVVVRDQAIKTKLTETTHMPFIATAPVIIVGVTTDLENKYKEVDVAIASDHIMLAGAELGIGSCWVGAIHNGEIAEAIGIKKGEAEVIFVMPLGYPADEAQPKKRKELNELVCEEKFKS